MPTRRILLLAAAVLVIALAGCVNYDERIELNPDGSGVARIHLAVSEQVLPPEFKPASPAEADLLPVPREELVKDLESQGFKVTSLRAESSQGLRHFYLVIEFKCLEDVSKSEFFGGRKASLKKDGARWEFLQEINVSEETLINRTTSAKKPKDEKPGTKPAPSDSAIKQLEARLGKEKVRQMFSNYSLNFSVQLKGATLLHTNGRNHQDAVALWGIPLDQLIETKPVLHMQADFAPVEKH
jgi:hypothetical protein